MTFEALMVIFKKKNTNYFYSTYGTNLLVHHWIIHYRRYADETGFHPSAPHLPKSVVPNHPEVQAAVDAQLR